MKDTKYEDFEIYGKLTPMRMATILERWDEFSVQDSGMIAWGSGMDVIDCKPTDGDPLGQRLVVRIHYDLLTENEYWENLRNESLF